MGGIDGSCLVVLTVEQRALRVETAWCPWWSDGWGKERRRAKGARLFLRYYVRLRSPEGNGSVKIS